MVLPIMVLDFDRCTFWELFVSLYFSSCNEDISEQITWNPNVSIGGTYLFVRLC
jgi:hypothetical protein